MDFSLNEAQRAWQMRARQFAEKEIRPISLVRDAIIWTHIAGDAVQRMRALRHLTQGGGEHR